jgi:hypothetical protein
MHLPTHLIPPRGFSVDPGRAPSDSPALLRTHTRYSHHTLDRRPAPWASPAAKPSSASATTRATSPGLTVRTPPSSDPARARAPPCLIAPHSADAARFGQSYLSKFGWDASKGLGAAGDGRTSHLKVHQKLDMLGIGAAHQKDPSGIAWKQNRDFESLLRRLNGSETEAEAVGTKLSGFSRAKEDGGDGDEGRVMGEKRKAGEVAEAGDGEKEKKRRKKEKKEKMKSKTSTAQDGSPEGRRSPTPVAETEGASPAEASNAIESATTSRSSSVPVVRGYVSAAPALSFPFSSTTHKTSRPLPPRQAHGAHRRRRRLRSPGHLPHLHARLRPGPRRGPRRRPRRAARKAHHVDEERRGLL